MRGDGDGDGWMVCIVVDAANVMGSRPDGWWRDRVGAARRLRDALAGLAERGLPAGSLPVGAGGLEVVFPSITLVVEGAARGVEPDPGARIDVARAPGSGDDEVVAQVAGTVRRDTGRNVLVVTADRELRQRVTDLGATVTGPQWLLSMLDQ